MTELFDKETFNPKWIKLIRWFLVVKSNEIKKDTRQHEKDIAANKEKFIKKCIADFKDISKSQISSSAIKFGKALRYKKKKQFIKDVTNALLVNLILALLVCMPIFSVILSNNHWSFILKIWVVYAIILIILLSLLTKVTAFIQIVLDKSSRTIKTILAFFLWVFLCFVSYNYYQKSDYLSILFFSIATSINILQTISYLNYFIVEPLIDLFMYKGKIVNIQYLILESAFNLNNKDISINLLKNNKYKNGLIEDLEKLASMIENEWPSEIITYDSNTHKWKQKTFQSIAISIRKKKRLIIIPSKANLTELKTHFNSYLINIINNDWQSFINEDIPSERIKKKSITRLIKSVVITFLPICTYITIEYFCPQIIPEHFKQITLLFAIIWLAMNILLWLDPNLLDKLSAAKTAKSLFDKGDGE